MKRVWCYIEFAMGVMLSALPTPDPPKTSHSKAPLRRPRVGSAERISRWCDEIGEDARDVLESEGALFFLLWLERRQAEGRVQ